WVAALPADAKSDLLVRFAGGDSQGARAELLRRFRDRGNGAPGAKPRTAAHLLSAAKRHAAERRRREATRAAAERVRRERAEAAAREEYLVRLAKREAQSGATWRLSSPRGSSRTTTRRCDCSRTERSRCAKGAGRRGEGTHS